MSRKKRDLNHEAEVLRSTVDPVDIGHEDPALQAVLSPEFVTMSNLDAVQVGMALQQIIRGQASLLGQSGEMAEAISKLNARMDKYDQAEAAWHENQDKFKNEVLARSHRKAGNTDQKARLRAQGLQTFQEEIKVARVVNTSNKLQFEMELKRMAKVDLVVPGHIVMTRSGDHQAAVLEGEEIRIRHMAWKLNPGVIYKVPKIVKDRYEQIMLDRQENIERQALLNGSNPKQDTVVAAGMAAISAKYGTKTEAFPLASQ